MRTSFIAMAWRAVSVIAVLQAVSAAPPTPSASLHLDAMLLQIADRFFPSGRLVVVFEVHGGRAASGVLSDGRWPGIVLGSRSRGRGLDQLPLCCNWGLQGERLGGAIIIGNSTPQVQKMFSRMRVEYAPLWNRTAHIVLLLVDRSQRDDMLAWIFEEHLYNVVLVGELQDRAVLYAPLPPGGTVLCHHEVHDLTVVDEWLPAEGVFVRGLSDVFSPRPDPKAVCARCPVRATRGTGVEDTYEFEAALITRMVTLIMAHLGCAVEYEYIKRSDFNQTSESTWERIKHGKADLIMRYLWMTHNRTLHYTATEVFEVELLYLYVTGKGVQDNLLALEGLVLVMVVLTSAANQGLIALRHRLGLGDSPSSVSFTAATFGAWSLYADQPSPSSQSAARGGIWAASWAAWTTLALTAISLNCMRRSQYAMTAIGPREKVADTIQELIDENVPLGIHDGVMYAMLMDSIANSSDPWKPVLVDCFTHVSYVEDCLKQLLESQGRFALMLNEAKMMTSLPANKRRELIYRIEAPFTSTPVVVYFSRDFPLVEAFSRIMNQLQGSGIVEQLYLRSMNFGVVDFREQMAAQMAGPYPISLKVLAPVLRFLGLMLLPLPVLCFLGELVLGHVLDRHRRNLPPARTFRLPFSLSIATLHV